MRTRTDITCHEFCEFFVDDALFIPLEIHTCTFDLADEPGFTPGTRVGSVQCEGDKPYQSKDC